jgi:multidrug efflux pump subunit AcrA (membrane-fusion protein)
MNRKNILGGIGVLTVLVVVYFIFFRATKQQVQITYEIKSITFKDEVQCSGELQAEFSEDIQGPIGLNRYNIYEMKIENIIPEGTEVKVGDFICSLDKSIINGQLNEANVNLEKVRGDYARTAIDTTLTLRQARLNIKNQYFEIEQKDLVLQQSKFEPPATIRQAELDLEKAKRDLEKAKEDYELKERQEVSRMNSIELDLKIYQDRINQLQDLQNSFVINAPKNGLLIYKTDWNGRKLKAGSSVNTWSPAVASLPDLSSMLTKTYINEVDIRKIKKDQRVTVGFDAFPNIKLPGKVITVANMGENQANSDSKVFEVIIKLEKLNPAVKPGMSTSNAILINEVKNQLTIPLDAIFTEKNISYTYVKNGSAINKQEIKIGDTNENEAIVLKGLKENEIVFLVEPESAKANKIVRL